MLARYENHDVDDYEEIWVANQQRLDYGNHDVDDHEDVWVAIQ